jgi:hypothetical protein
MAVVFPYVKNAAWVDGTTVATAAKANIWEDGIFNAHQQPAVRVFHNANQSLTNITLTALAFNSERFDTAGGSSATHHDTVTNNSRLTCLYAGKYQITGSASFAANATGHRLLLIRLNGATEIARERVPSVGASDQLELNISTLYDLAINDYVELVAYQNSGGALNVTVVSNYSPEFMFVRVA